MLMLARVVMGAAVLAAAVVGRTAEASVHHIEADAGDYFIRQWLAVGPFPSVPLAQPTPEGYTRDGFARDFLVSLGGEPKAVLTAETSVAGVGPPRAVQANADGAVDLTQVYGEGERRVAYLFSWIESAEDQTITCFFSSDDGGRVWVNGEHVHEAWVPGGRGVRFREETFRANLKRGRNRVLVKVEQNGPGWAAAVEALPRRIAPALLEPSLQLQPRIQLLDRRGAAWSARITAELNHDATLFPQIRQRLQVSDTAAQVLFAATMAAGEEAVIELEPGAYFLAARADAPKPMGGEAALLAAEDPVVWASRAREQARTRSHDGADTGSAGWFAYLAEKLDRALATPDRSTADLALQAYRALRWSAALDENPAAFLQQRGATEWAYRSTVDGSGQPFTLRIPETYSSAQEWPLVVQLHGAGGTHGDRWGDPHPERTLQLQVNGRGRTGGYQGLSEVDVLEAVAYVQQHWRIAPDQVHLSGGSMGGYGTFALAARYPDRWASAVPWAGSAAHLPTENMLNLPTYALQSDDDLVVPVSGARAGVRWLNQAGGMAILAETSGLGHQFGRWVEGRAKVQRWRDGRKRADPKTIRRILYTATDESARGAYWIRVEEWGARGAPARVHARFDHDNALYLEASNARVIRVAVDASPADPARDMHVSVNGRPTGILEPPLPAELFVRLDEGAPRVTTQVPEPAAFRLHFQGGVAALYQGEPVTVVYGTTGGPETTERLRALAQTISQWSRFSAGGELGAQMTFGALPVKPDRAMTAEELTRSNLILLGGETENALAARLVKRLPVTVDPEKQRLVADDGQSWAWTGGGWGLLHYNPEHPQRLIYWIAANEVSLYDPGSVLVALNAGREPAPDFMLVDRAGRLVAARRFDSRWRWEPGYGLSPPLASPANDTAAARIRRALACDFVVQEHATGEQAPWNHVGDTRVADLAAFAYSHRLATLTLSGAELRQAGAALERGPIRIWPRGELADIEDERRYRVGLVGLDMRGFVRATRLEPNDFALVDLTLRDVLWPE